MSVILYEDEKFLRIYQTMRIKRGGQEYAHLFHYPEGWQDSKVMDQHYRSFAEDLRRANTITWNRQYPDDVQPLSALDFDSCGVNLGGVLAQSTIEPYHNDIEFLKSLRGLRYNLIDNEGQETDLLGCMKILNHLIDEVGYAIISRLPEWSKADTW